MTRTDRLTGIILALQNGRQTAAQLAARFEVSRRTILRDVDALGQIGVPVVALPGAGGGFALADGYRLPPLHFSAAEAAVLLLALRGLGEGAASPFGEARRAAEEKLRGALRPETLAAAEAELDAIAVAPPARPPDPALFRRLRAAIGAGDWVRVEYESLRRAAGHDLFPLRLDAVDGRWYCTAVSLEAGEERSYRLDRMRTLTPILAPPGGAEARRRADRPRRAYDDPTHPEVVLRLSYRGLRLAEDRFPGVGGAEQVDPETWLIRFRCPPGELPYYASEVHALGPTAEAAAPPALRALVRDLIAATAAVDDGDGTTATPSAEW